MIDNPACEQAVGCGEWKAPLIPNKEYKGKWRPPLIGNPNYQGKWAARKIPNPDYFEDLTPFKMTPIVSANTTIHIYIYTFLFFYADNKSSNRFSYLSINSQLWALNFGRCLTVFCLTT